uniref:Uncharacterized protein n=1 Tax=viral metagenome TaxID=1070528 RepID=A0A6M3XYH1_9ZZZZ
MWTGVFIRTEVDGRWRNYDIGDPVLPDQKVIEWLRDHQLESGFTERLVLILLGRHTPVVEGQKGGNSDGRGSS